MKTPIPVDRITVALLITALLASTAGAAVVLSQNPNEPNDGQDNATSIAPGQQVDAAIESDDIDWYSVDGVERGQSVEAAFSLDTNASEGVILSVYDPNGTRLDVPSRIVEPGESVAAGTIAERSGTYYVEVYPLTDAAGGYSLEFSVTDTDDFEPNQNWEVAT